MNLAFLITGRPPGNPQAHLSPISRSHKQQISQAVGERYPHTLWLKPQISAVSEIPILEEGAQPELLDCPVPLIAPYPACTL